MKKVFDGEATLSKREEKEESQVGFSRIHPLLPTRREVDQDPSQAYSDHLPILVKVPLPDCPATLNIVSLNTLGFGSGIHSRQTDGLDTENRYRRIAESLTRMIRNNHVHALALQEVDSDFETKESFIERYLPAQLENMFDEQARPDAEINGLSFKKWRICCSPKGKQLVTCYDTERLELYNGSEKYDQERRIFSHRFRHKGTDLVIDLHNVWGIFSNFPDQREPYYRELLLSKEFNDSVIRVLIGDFNCPIAPVVNEQLHNIITDSIPEGYISEEMRKLAGNKELEQVGGFPDGAFLGQGHHIQQMPHQILTFKGGEIFDGSTEMEDDINYIKRYKMILCLDEHYWQEKYLDNQTIFDYEHFLQASIGDNNICVRMAATSMNEKAIGLRLTKGSVFSEELQAWLAEKNIDYQCQDIDDFSGKIFPTIFVPLAHSCQLVQAVSEILDKIKKTNYYQYGNIMPLSLSRFFSYDKDEEKSKQIHRHAEKEDSEYSITDDGVSQPVGNFFSKCVIF